METLNLKYSTLTYYPEKSMVEFTANSSSVNQKDDDYKTESIATCVFIEKHKPIYFLSDLSEYQTLVSIELQEWAAKEASPRILKAGVKKIAIVVSNDFIVQMSVEQNANEVSNEIANQFETELQYFLDRFEAEKWLIS